LHQTLTYILFFYILENTLYKIDEYNFIAHLSLSCIVFIVRRLTPFQCLCACSSACCSARWHLPRWGCGMW